MPDYAPGTQEFGQGSERRMRHQIQRNLNIGDFLNGAGALMQALGANRRNAETQANEAYLAQQVQQEEQGGLGGGVAGPQEAPRYAEPGTMFTNMVNTMNPLYRPQGGLTGSGALQLANLREAKARTMADAQYRQDSLDTQRRGQDLAAEGRDTREANAQRRAEARAGERKATAEATQAANQRRADTEDERHYLDELNNILQGRSTTGMDPIKQGIFEEGLDENDPQLRSRVAGARVLVPGPERDAALRQNAGPTLEALNALRAKTGRPALSWESITQQQGGGGGAPAQQAMSLLDYGKKVAAERGWPWPPSQEQVNAIKQEFERMNQRQ